jgi:hypothetical protein
MVTEEGRRRALSREAGAGFDLFNGTSGWDRHSTTAAGFAL